MLCTVDVKCRYLSLFPSSNVDGTSVGEENETFFIRVWKPLSSRHVLKSRGETQKGKPGVETEARKGKPKEDNIC